MADVSMTSRERVICALRLREPDRVPIDFWASAGFRRKLEVTLDQSYESFLDRHDVDLRYIAGPAYIGPLLREYPDGTREDLWGVRRKRITVATADGGTENYAEVAESPLTDAVDVESVAAYPRWPSADWFDYGGIAEQCARIRRQGRAVVFMGDRLNRVAQLKPAMYLRGIEQIMMDMSLNPDLAHALFRRIRDFYLDYCERILAAADGMIDILLTGDDFGSQNGLLISPAMWSEFIGPGFKAYIDLAKRYDVRVIHHTCGSVRPIIPLMIDAGLDMLQSLQPEAADMESAALKREFGDRIGFHGGISIQRTLPFGSPDDVRREVGDRVRELAPGGGYILCTAHNIQADVPVDNVQALVDAYHAKHGYPG